MRWAEAQGAVIQQTVRATFACSKSSLSRALKELESCATGMAKAEHLEK